MCKICEVLGSVDIILIQGTVKSNLFSVTIIYFMLLIIICLITKEVTKDNLKKWNTMEQLISFFMFRFEINKFLNDLE